MADSFLRQDDITLLERKDYIQNPKPSGYRSLHLIVQVPIFLQDEKKPVTVEVQFRTIAMDFWASLEHKMRYKKNIPANLSFLSFVADIKRTQNHIHQPQIFTLGTGSQISDIRFRPT